MAVGVQKAFSTTAASNASADSNINFAEGQTPASLNNSDRAFMAAIKAFANQILGAKTTGGSANAQTFTSDAPGAISTAYAAGMGFVFVAGYTNSGACTLNVDGVGAVAIRKGGANSALAANDIVVGGVYFVVYNGTYWILLNPETGQTSTGNQPLDALLTAIAALTTADDRMLDFTGTDTVAVVNYATVLSNIGAQAVATLLTAILAIDGASSGIDADLLDGAQGAAYALLAGSTFTGDVIRPTNQTGHVAGSVGYIGTVISAMSGDRTVANVDDGQTLYHTSASTHTLTIDSNANLALPIGFMVAIENENGGGNVSIAITSDTLRWGSATGTRTLLANGSAVLKKVAATVWRLTGTGLA